jgi:SAM-dependent methyltransferase
VPESVTAAADTPAGRSLAGAENGVPERFVPAEMAGELVAAEHLARYGWACRLVRGRRVLDAGCGAGYGSAMLSAAGADAVTGVDRAQAVLEVAQQGAPENVRFEVADVASLPFAAASFDAVVCFEVIEHVEDRDAVLDELRRVLAPDGLLIISSPNRDRYVPGNPHHRHEYTPRELRAALEARFPAVALVAQHAMLASVVSAAPAAGPLAQAAVASLVEPQTDDELYTLAVAGLTIPELGAPTVTLTHTIELRGWLEHYQRLEASIAAQALALEELEAVRAERGTALAMLCDREQERERLTGEVADLCAQVAALEAEIVRARAVLAAVLSSPSWRITAPLRALKRLLARG